jgi:hypothetical protein
MQQYHEDSLRIVVLLDRFRLQRLPVAQGIRQRVVQGHRLAEHEIEFLWREFASVQELRPLATRNPEVAQLMGSITYLYKEIVDTALANEQRR